MAAKTVSIDNEDIPWNLYPKDWPDVIKRDYQEKTRNIVDTAGVANDASETSQAEKERNDKQDSEILANKEANAQTKESLESHKQSNSAHGVKGNNVGTEDYAGASVGGVVLSATNIKPVSLRTVSIDSAPDSYDKEYIQKLADAINDLNSNQQAIASKIEEALNAQKDAKQMQPDSEV